MGLAVWLTPVVKTSAGAAEPDAPATNETAASNDVAASASAEQLRGSDGAPRNASLVRILFDQPVSLADGRAISIAAMATDPASGLRARIAIPLLSVHAQSARELRLVTGRQVPRGAAVTFAAGALHGVAATSATVVAEVAQSDLEARHFVLALRAFAGSDASVLPQRRVGAIPVALLPAPRRQTLYHDFAQFMRRKQALGLISAETFQALLARYHAPETRAVVPHETLRAALLSLAGTAFEGAIAAVLDGDNQSGRPYAAVSFGRSMPAAVVAEGRLRRDGAFEIILNRRYRHEPFAALSALMAHEPLHQDPIFNGLNEEAISQVAESLAYAQQLLVAPELAQVATPLIRLENAAVMKLLNSGKAAFPRVGVKSSPAPRQAGPVVLRAHAGLGFEATSRSVNRRAGRPDIDTPGNALLDLYLRNITGREDLGDLDFDQATMQLIDAGQSLIDNDDALRLARYLKLSIFPDSVPQ